jgi:ABC-type sugar transport system substrate-binding protein
MLRFVLSLVSQDNDYQRAKAAAGEEMAHRLGLNVEVMFCNGDAIEQSRQLLTIIQSRTPTPRINGIVVQPAGTGLRKVAEAAAAAGIGWAVLHKEVDYIAELLKRHRVPVFMVSSDHAEEGRIQAKQLALLLRQGGLVVCVMGPRADSITERRFEGLKQAIPGTRLECPKTHLKEFLGTVA